MGNESQFDLVCELCYINCAANKATTFAITDIKLYVPVVTLSIQDNAKLL